MTDIEIRNLLYKLQLKPSDNKNKIINALRHLGLTTPKDFSIYDGACKNCIIFKNYPWAIKWAYTFSSKEEALREVTFYNLAVEEGIDDFFPKTEFLCEINGSFFIKQQIVPVCLYDVDDYPEIRNKIFELDCGDEIEDNIYRKLMDSLDCPMRRSDLWSTAALIVYGKQKCNTFCNFVKDYCINDLHERNVGFVGIHPMVLDFSGY